MRYLAVDVGSMTCKYVYCNAEGDIVAQAYARHDGRPAETSGEDNTKTLAVVEAAYRSAESSRSVEVETFSHPQK